MGCVKSTLESTLEFANLPLKIAKNEWKTCVFATPHFGPPADLIRKIRWLQKLQENAASTYSVSLSVPVDNRGHTVRCSFSSGLS